MLDVEQHLGLRQVGKLDRVKYERYIGALCSYFDVTKVQAPSIFILKPIIHE